MTAMLLSELPNSLELTLTEIVASIELPSNDWKILSMPGLPPPAYNRSPSPRHTVIATSKIPYQC